MKTFKVKDLMVSLEEKKGELGADPALCPTFVSQCAFHTCLNPTLLGCYHGCTFHQPTFCYLGCTFIPTHIGCNILSRICTPTPYIGVNTFVGDPELGQLKEQMEKFQKEVDDQLKPQTIEDLDQLESKLNEALAELKTQRASMKKGK
jgi:hypothetical protein